MLSAAEFSCSVNLSVYIRQSEGGMNFLLLLLSRIRKFQKKYPDFADDRNHLMC